MTQITWISSKIDEPKISRALLLEELKEMFGAEVNEMIRDYGFIIVSRKRFDELKLCYHELVSANRQGCLVQFRKNRLDPKADDRSGG